MKKFLCFLLVAVVCFCCTGCGDNTNAAKELAEEYAVAYMSGNLTKVAECGIIDLEDCLSEGNYTVFTLKGYLNFQSSTYEREIVSVEDLYVAYEDATKTNNPGLSVTVNESEVTKCEMSTTEAIINEIETKFGGIVDTKNIDNIYEASVSVTISMNAGALEKDLTVKIVETGGELKVYSPHILELLGGFNF